MALTSSLYQQHLTLRLKELDEMLAESGFDAVLIHSGVPKLRFMDDYHYPFAVNPYFKALVPLEVPFSFIYYQPNKKPLLVYYQPQDYWHVTPEIPTEPWVDAFELEVIKEVSEAKQLIPKNNANIAYIGEDASHLTWFNGKVNPEILIARFNDRRVYKTPYELSCLRKANEIGVKGHLAAKELFFQGGSELEVHLGYLKACGCEQNSMPYNNIVAFNEHGATLHYDHYDNQLVNGRSCLIDAGASYLGYASDITRTYSRDEGCEFAKLVVQMDQAQQQILQLIKPGACYVQLHREFHKLLAKLLAEFNLINASAETIFAKGWTKPFMPHGLGHFLGLQVHDVAGWQISPQGEQKPRHSDYPALRLQRKLKENMVVTIEPGLYFIDSLLRPYQTGDTAKVFNWKKIESLKPFGGVRIEDDLKVNAQGCENLTREAFAKQES